MNIISFRCRLVSCLMLLTLILHWKVPVVPFQLLRQPDILNNPWMGSIVYIAIMGVLFLMLNLIAAMGLFTVKTWSFNVSYLAVISSTLSGISYLPFYKFFVLPLFSSSIMPMIIINLVLLLYVIYLDITYRKITKSKLKV